MGINPHHRHVAPVPCRQIGERYHADGTLPSQRNNPVGSRGPQHRQRRLRLAEDDIAVDNAVLYRAGCHGGIHRNGFHLFPHTFATLLYNLPNRKSSVRHGPVFLSFPGNYRTHRA